MILESFVAVNSVMFVTRVINTKIEQKMREKILSDGIYHVTTEENAGKIMESGHIRPSNMLLSWGRKKCFFFAGTPSYKDLASNCASEAKKYEFKAVKLMPNQDELSKFRQRSFNDDSITFVGKCNLPKERTKIVDLVLDIDEKGNIYTREKTEQELDKEYIPKDELVQKMNRLTNNMIGIMGKAYLQEYNTVGKKFTDKFKKIMEKMMAEEKDESYYQNTISQDEINKYKSNNINSLLDMYKYDEFEVSKNYTGNEDIKGQEQNLIIEEEERVCE